MQNYEWFTHALCLLYAFYASILCMFYTHFMLVLCSLDEFIIMQSMHLEHCSSFAFGTLLKYNHQQARRNLSIHSAVLLGLLSARVYA
jgi:hypothetical protein